MRISTLTVIGIALLQAGNLLAWTTPERVDRKPPGYAAYYPCIAVGRDGLPQVAWSEVLVQHAIDKVMYARRDGDTWTAQMNVSRDSGDIRFPAIALDSAGGAVVVWSQEGTTTIRYVRQMDDSWSLPKLCFPNKGITPRLVSDSRGQVHLLFEELTGHGGIWYSYYVPEADTWATPIAVATSTSPLGWSSLAVDRLDHLHAVWGDWGTYGVDYSTFDGIHWSVPEAVPDPYSDRQSCDPCVAVDTAGRPYVFWQERAGGYWLYWSYLKDSSWRVPSRFYSAEGGNPSAAGDSAGRVHVIWNCWDNNGLLHTGWTDTCWTVPETVEAGSCFESGLAVAGSSLHAIWRRGGSLFYGRQAVPGMEERGQRDGRAGGDWLRAAAGASTLLLHLDEPETVDLMVYDATGTEVFRARPQFLVAGTHAVSVVAADLASGVYFCRLRAGTRVLSAKMMQTR